MSQLDADITIREPRAEDFSLYQSPTIDGLSLRLAGAAPVRFSLGWSDREAEAQAMDRLAELAAEAAAWLRGGTVTRLCEVGSCDRSDAEPFQACGTYYVCPADRARIENLSVIYQEQDAAEAAGLAEQAGAH